jgi:hypothetical protein
MALQPIIGTWKIFIFLLLYAVFMTPWTEDQPVARPLPTHKTTQIYTKHTPDIYTSSGIRTYVLSVCAGQDSSCLTLLGPCEYYYYYYYYYH